MCRCHSDVLPQQKLQAMSQRFIGANRFDRLEEQRMMRNDHISPLINGLLHGRITDIERDEDTSDLTSGTANKQARIIPVFR